MNLNDLLLEMVEKDASDLHLKAGSPPGLRVHGELVPIKGCAALTAEDTHALVEELLDDEVSAEFDDKKDLDFSKHISGVARFRVNVFHQRGSRGCVMRLIPIEVPVLEDMKFPDIVRKLCHKPRGLVLVTGPTGSGKSTTLAAMIDYVNRSFQGHILTLEDPIEFVHNDKRCYVNQREIGHDSRSFSNALRAAMREDPDHILVGEMRDLETIGLAITAAETGHLVFGTLHTTSAIQTVDRIIDVFPHDAQEQVRTQLSATLQGVISQTLLPKVGGGRIAAQEVMIGTDAVRSCVREGKTPQLINMLQTGAQYGMQTLEAHLAEMVLARKVTLDDAIAKSNSPLSLKNILEKSQESAAAKKAVKEPVPAGPVGPPGSDAAVEDVGSTSGSPQIRATSGDTIDEFEKFRAKRKSE